MSKKYLRQRRQFSPTLRKQIVRLIESGSLSVAAASREYLVSTTSIYRWIHRYSTYNKKGALLVVDKDSHSQKIERLQQKIAELEQAVGHKQMQIDYYEKFIDLASEEVGQDLKKSTPALLRVVLRKQKSGPLAHEGFVELARDLPAGRPSGHGPHAPGPAGSAHDGRAGRAGALGSSSDGMPRHLVCRARADAPRARLERTGAAGVRVSG